ncbi:unnamed protein product, partial [Iphiclides podalirius]
MGTPGGGDGVGGVGGVRSGRPEAGSPPRRTDASCGKTAPAVLWNTCSLVYVDDNVVLSTNCATLIGISDSFNGSRPM